MSAQPNDVGSWPRPFPAGMTVADPRWTPGRRLLAWSHAFRDAEGFRVGLVIAVHAAACALLAGFGARWPPAASLAAGLSLVAAAWLAIDRLALRPARSRLAQAEGDLAQLQATTAERDMIMGVLGESETRLRAIFNNSPNGVIVIEPDTQLPIDFNDTMPRLLGYSRSEFTSVPMLHYVVEEPGHEVLPRLDRVLRGIAERFTGRCRSKGGEIFDASFSAQLVTVDGQPAISCIVRDISQERRAEQALHLTHDKMQTMISELERRNQERMTLTELGGILQACVSLTEAYSAVSRFGARLFPATSGALYVYSASRTDLELAAHWAPPAGGFEAAVGPEDCWSLRRGHLYDRTDVSTTLACQHVGEDELASYLCVPLTAQGETLGFLHLRAAEGPGTPGTRTPDLIADRTLVVTVADQVTLGLANLRLRDTLRQQSIHDALTGLFNRRYLEETLRREIPRAIRSGRPLAVVMADLDHFKRFNDTFGHEAGDVVLSELGLLLKTSVRSSDIACRYGGEEFALVLPDASLAATLERVESIRQRVSQLSVRQRDRALGGLTLSLGIAVLPLHGSTAEDLLRAADKALYRAKQAGRDQAQVALAPES